MTGTYITNGLTHFWDGINKGGVARTWKDLVGDIDLYVNGTVSETELGWSLAGGYMMSGVDHIIAETYGVSTIEMVFRVDSIASGKTVFLFVSGPNTVEKPILAIDSYNRIIYSNKTQRPVHILGNSWKGMPHRVSKVGGRCVVDMVSWPVQGTATYKNNKDNYTYIGKRNKNYSDNTAFWGEVYCVRVYDRQLTEAEMRYNQSVDEMRFRLWGNQ